METRGLDRRRFDPTLPFRRSLVNKMRRDGLVRVLVLLLVKGSGLLLLLTRVSGKVEWVLICNPELLVAPSELFTNAKLVLVTT